MLIYAEMRGTYDRKVAYIFAQFEKIQLNIKEIIGHTLTCGRLLGQPL